jgi:uncharacterized protein YigE (DUF2233 family)
MLLMVGSVSLWPLDLWADEKNRCAGQSFEGIKLTVCSFDPKTSELRLFWKNRNGQPFKTFARLAEEVASNGKRLTFAINGGMYSETYEPVGLYVEDGRELQPANTKTVSGSPGSIPNFYKKPNGVFFLADDGAGIMTTEAYIARSKDVEFATQSGPMLVVQNKLHPAFILGSTDKTRRSGVGISSDGIIYFAISDDEINFHGFARFFRDQLKCPDALFLDGGRGAGVYIPTIGRNDWSWHGGFGPMIGAVE